MFGNTGKILEVDLSANKISTLELNEDVYKSFLGGSGLAAKIFFDRKLYKVDPLSPDNLLMFMIGPLTGSTFPGVSRFEVCARSPLTGIWGEASCGAWWGAELKRTGYDGIIVSGAASSPVYLWITDDGKPEIRNAEFIWGQDTYQLEETLTEHLKEGKIQIASIGPAGENLVRYAAILTDKGDAAARCGMGCVMGSKKLKAIVLKGKQKIKFADEEKYKKLRSELNEKIQLHHLTRMLHQYGTNGSMSLGVHVGDVPIKNWQRAEWAEGTEKIDGIAITENILVKAKSCFSCPIACKRVVKVDKGNYKVEEGPGPEYESAAALGSLLMNDDLSAVAKANELCNRLGMDTISCGSTIGWAMECYEKGLLSDKDTDGIQLKWGNHDAIIDILPKIAHREGIGNLLADGVKAASEKLGQGSEKFALHIKGQEIPMHDPRAYHSFALGYATSTRGACHTHDINIMVEMGVSQYPELGIKGDYNPLSGDRKADLTMRCQHYGMLYGSAVMCHFVAATISASDMLNMVNTATGWDWDISTMVETAERIWNMKRAIGFLCSPNIVDNIPQRLKEPYIEGVTSGLDTIIDKMMKTKMPENPKVKKIVLDVLYNKVYPGMKKTKGLLNFITGFTKQKMIKNPYRVVPDFDKMLKEYYELRKYRKDGKPTREKLEELGLADVANELEV